MKLVMINVGTKVIIEKGCKARNITKGATAKVTAIEELGPDYSSSVRVTLHFLNSFMSGKTVSFYARHINRLADGSVALNDGRPEHRIWYLPAHEFRPTEGVFDGKIRTALHTVAR